MALCDMLMGVAATFMAPGGGVKPGVCVHLHYREPAFMALCDMLNGSADQLL